jgi:hypothetical protein
VAMKESVFQLRDMQEGFYSVSSEDLLTGGT